MTSTQSKSKSQTESAQEQWRSPFDELVDARSQGRAASTAATANPSMSGSFTASAPGDRSYSAGPDPGLGTALVGAAIIADEHLWNDQDLDAAGAPTEADDPSRILGAASASGDPSVGTESSIDAWGAEFDRQMEETRSFAVQERQWGIERDYQSKLAGIEQEEKEWREEKMDTWADTFSAVTR